MSLCQRRQRLAMSLLLPLLVIGGTLTSRAQTALLDGAKADTLKIAFLHQLQRYANADVNTKIQLASRLGVSTSDLAPVFAAARDFAAAERALMMEAGAYRQRQQALSRPMETRSVQEFAARRFALARAAIDSLQTTLSPASYAAFRRYLTSEFPKSVAFWR